MTNLTGLTHYLAGGIVVIQDGKLLVVRDSTGWTLPRGSTEIGEPISETSRREGIEETGFDIVVNDIAFIVEFKTEKYGQFLQVYYQ
jgi:ADP-ribose pyrophosphatase YjhB (NUDIX family)